MVKWSILSFKIKMLDQIRLVLKLPYLSKHLSFLT